MSSGRDRMARKDARFGEVKNFWGDPVATQARTAKMEAQIKNGLPPLFVKVCEDCGRKLGWGTLHTGAKKWIDLEAKVYCPVFEKTDSHGVVLVRTELAYLDHSELCNGPNPK